ncbi:hypothetical protein [Desulforhabdus sp. TSK]|uniref:hypothetical protein n=1 Tax=Desulforhabdus sp. TSK TaxID=2925014 RepID=UPI001FC87E34|nr:hypothetical protein [Desulforhabdus sp. TSK]
MKVQETKEWNTRSTCAPSGVCSADFIPFGSIDFAIRVASVKIDLQDNANDEACGS